MTLDQLKSYHSTRVDALCPGHPEIEHEGIEVTTGPLGQGVANAVGLAIASKHLGSQYNRPGFEVVNNHTWCMVGDACLQEGVGLEAISLAGHLRLNNLTVMYDNNQVTCDGSVDLTNTEDVNAKMTACGWDVISIEDGSYDIEGIVDALNRARNSRERPTFINVKTIIGLNSAVAGKAQAHGAAFGAEDVASIKVVAGFDPQEHFVISDTVRHFFAECPSRGEGLVQDWRVLVERYSDAYPELGKEFSSRVSGTLPDWDSLIPSSFPSKPTASRASSGLVFNPIAEKVKNFMVGTADLSPSVNMIYPGKVDFQNVSLAPGSSHCVSYISDMTYSRISAQNVESTGTTRDVTYTMAYVSMPWQPSRTASLHSLRRRSFQSRPHSSCFISMRLPLFVWVRFSGSKSFMPRLTTPLAWAKTDQRTNRSS